MVMAAYIESLSLRFVDYHDKTQFYRELYSHFFFVLMIYSFIENFITIFFCFNKYNKYSFHFNHKFQPQILLFIIIIIRLYISLSLGMLKNIDIYKS